jgi:nitrogen-specific signal transduction histidine kinase
LLRKGDNLEGERLKAIGLMANVLAHEFSNRLCGVGNVLERMVRKPGLPDAEQEVVRLALEQCGRMQHLVQALQDFLHAPSEQRTTFDLHQALTSVLELTGKMLQVSQVTLQPLYDSTPLRVEGVESQIKLLVLHLLQRACQCLASCGATMTLDTVSDGPQVRIVLHFEAAAAPSEAMADLFASLISSPSAVGSGRSLLEAIVDAHGGVLHQTASSRESGALVFSLPAARE